MVVWQLIPATYSNNRDDMLTYVAHGHVEIDNNGIERDVRPLAVGLRNWLFLGSPEAGERAAILYSLLISARHHGHNPEQNTCATSSNACLPAAATKPPCVDCSQRTGRPRPANIASPAVAKTARPKPLREHPAPGSWLRDPRSKPAALLGRLRRNRNHR